MSERTADFPPLLSSERPVVILPVALLAVCGFSLAVLAIVLRGTPQALSPAYYAVMCLIGAVALRGRMLARTTRLLRRPPIPTPLRALLFGYLAVVAEETLVGTIFALSEGFSVHLLIERVGQFVAFNLLAFTGAIVGLTVAAHVFPRLSRCHLLVAGGWGLFAERTLAIAVSNPIGGLLIAGPTIAVYSVILAPLVLSIPARAGHPSWWHPLAAWALMFVASLPPVALLFALRAAAPEAFPPCDYIPCTPAAP